MNSNGAIDKGEMFISESHSHEWFYASFNLVDDGPSENPDGTPGNGTPTDAFSITVTLVGYDVEILNATSVNVPPVFTAHPAISITYDEMGKRVAVAEVSAIHDPGIHDHHSLALHWFNGESNTYEMRCVTNTQSCPPNAKTGRIASKFPESYQSAFPLKLLLTDDDTGVASYRIEKLNVLRSSTAGDVPGQNGEAFPSQASSASTSLRGLNLSPFLSTAMDAETGVFELIYGDNIRLWDSPEKHRVIVSGSYYQTDIEGMATTTYTGQETVWVEGVAAGQTEITLAWFPDSQYSTAGATSVLPIYAGTVIVQVWEALLEVKAISDGPLQGAEFVEETEDHLVFTTDALFEVAAFMPPEAEISGDVLVEVFADDLLVEQFSFTVSPGGEYRYPIVVPALNRSTLNVRASLVQDQGVVEEEEQPVVGLELKIGGSQLNATLTTAQLQELADSQVNKGFQAMFESLAERDSSIAMIINENDNIGTPEQAEAYYDQVRNQIARRLADGIKPHLDDVVEGLFAEKKPLMINVGKAKEQQADGLKEHWDSIGSRLDQQKLPEAFSIDFIDKDDILGAFRSALKETIDAKLIGQDVNFDTFLNQHLQWKEIEFVKGIGFKLPFDLLPGQTDNPLGTLFLGTGGFSVNSFGPDWKDNQSLKINITQPLMEWENKRLSFEIGGGYKFNGDLDGVITGKFEADFR